MKRDAGGMSIRRGSVVPRRGAGLLSLVIWLMAASCASAAEFKLASYFGDQMVIQRNQPIPVWGSGVPESTVEISLGSHRGSATVDAQGRWEALLDPLQSGGPLTLKVTSNGEQFVVQDILCGDVWLCSGQSNMAMELKDCDDGDATAQQAGMHPRLRLCTVARGFNGSPQENAKITWSVSSPESAQNFSAVSYYFAEYLLNSGALEDTPIGLVNSSFGGTACEGWIPNESLKQFSSDDLHDSMFGIKPGMLYNAMIAPLGPIRLKGVLWYQGESNSAFPDMYPKLLGTMIAEWRKQFSSPELPFLVVQLPEWAQKWQGYYWPWIRETQEHSARETPQTYLATGLGTTDGFNLHPREKREIGRRLSLLARKFIYGEDIVAQGPRYESVVVDGNELKVTFDPRGSGLAVAGKALEGFQLAGDDGVYRFAQARIEGNKVIVTHPQIAEPKTVRYAWSAVPSANLVNTDGLPAPPFRTDNFAASSLEIQPAQPGRTFSGKNYVAEFSQSGRLEGLAIGGKQFVSNEPGAAGGTSMNAADGNPFGAVEFVVFEETGPMELRIAGSAASMLVSFDEAALSWTLTNSSEKELRFRLVLSPLVKATSPEAGGNILLQRNRVAAIATGVDKVSSVDESQALDVILKPGETRTLQIAVKGM